MVQFWGPTTESFAAISGKVAVFLSIMDIAQNLMEIIQHMTQERSQDL
jgi:hypothetical protein